jgi:hypothetical protein
MKLCQKCRGTFAGGDFCPACGVQQPLTDFAGGAAGPHLIDEELNLAVQAHYAERAGMVRSVLVFFLAPLGNLWVLWAVAATVGGSDLRRGDEERS